MASPPAPWAAPEMPLLGRCRPPHGCPRGRGRPGPCAPAVGEGGCRLGLGPSAGGVGWALGQDPGPGRPQLPRPRRSLGLSECGATRGWTRCLGLAGLCRLPGPVLVPPRPFVAPFPGDGMRPSSWPARPSARQRAARWTLCLAPRPVHLLPRLIVLGRPRVFCFCSPLCLPSPRAPAAITGSGRGCFSEAVLRAGSRRGGGPSTAGRSLQGRGLGGGWAGRGCFSEAVCRAGSRGVPAPQGAAYGVGALGTSWAGKWCFSEAIRRAGSWGVPAPQGAACGVGGQVAAGSGPRCGSPSRVPVL